MFTGSLRSLALLGMFACLAGLVSGAARTAAAQERPPNVLFILADDLGWGDLGCYGNRQIQTPNLDRLASQGTLFTQFYVNGSVCSPTRTAFMTGRYPARHRIHGHLAAAAQNQARGMPNWLDPAAPTLPRLLKRVGYRTAHFGKWHLGSGAGAPGPDAYGIDVHRTVNANGPTWDQKDPFFRAKSTGLIVDETLKFIAADPRKPFYVNAWTLVPHAPLSPTEEQMEPYRRLAPDASVPHKSAAQIYYSSVADLDRQVGRLLDGLDAMGLQNETMVVFSSDNGPEEIAIRNAGHSGVGSPGPFRGRKRSLYEGGVRVPMIVRWPGHVSPATVNSKAVLTAVDLLPTVCRLAGAAAPDAGALDGEDIADLVAGTREARAKPIMWEWRFNIAGHVVNRSPILSIRYGNWKLLMNPDRSRVELYDIPKDPSELNNQADRQPDVVRRLSETLQAWQKTLPPGPVDAGAGKNDYPWPG